MSCRAGYAIAEQDVADSSLEGTLLTAGAYHVASYAVGCVWAAPWAVTGIQRAVNEPARNARLTTASTPAARFVALAPLTACCYASHGMLVLRAACTSGSGGAGALDASRPTAAMLQVVAEQRWLAAVTHSAASDPRYASSFTRCSRSGSRRQVQRYRAQWAAELSYQHRVASQASTTR